MDIEITEKWADRVFAVILAVAGFFCFYRLGYYSLWGDETWVASAALSPVYDVFFSGTYFPGNPFFIFLIKMFVTVFGATEFTFRFIPALFYVLSVAVFYFLLKILTKKNYIVTLIATALFALNPTLIWFSHDLKQYTIEIFFTLLLFYLAERYVLEKTKRNFLILTIASVFSVLFSFPSVFVIPALALRLAGNEYSKGDRIFSKYYFSKIKGILFYAVIATAVFLVDFLLFIRTHAQEQRHVWYWTESWSCMPTDYSLSYLIHFVYDSLFSFFQYLFYYSNFETWHYGVLFALFLIGVVYAFYKKEYPILVYGLVPIILNIFASLVKKYPFCGARIDLYLTPFIFVFIAYAFYTGVLMFRFDEKLMRVLVVIFIVCASLSIILVHGQETLSLDQIRLDGISQFYRDNFKNDSDYVYFAAPWMLYAAYFEERPFVRDINKFNVTRLQSNQYLAFLVNINNTGNGTIVLTPKEDTARITQKVFGHRLWVFFEILDREDKIKRYLGVTKEFEKYCKLLVSNKDEGVVLDLYQC